MVVLIHLVFLDVSDAAVVVAVFVVVDVPTAKLPDPGAIGPLLNP